MSDLFGHEPPKTEVRDIRPTRDYVAEEKAVLCLQLNELCQKCPPKVINGGYRLLVAWRHALDGAKKTLASRKSSRNELAGAIERMRGYYK